MKESLDMKQSLYTSLLELGLTESEANLYVTSLALGPTTIAALGEHLGISRPNVYKVILGVERHGLAKFSEKKRYARTFMVEAPTVVLEKLREKREVMAGLDQVMVQGMPDFLAMYHQGELPTKIKVFSGKEQWVKLFFQVLDEAKGEIQFFGSADAFIQLVSWEMEKEWIKQRVEKRIHLSALLTPGADAETLQRTDEVEMRTTKFVTGALPFVTGFMLYGNKVIIWQPKAPLLVLVEDEYIVAMLKSIFFVMWKMNVV